MKETLKWFVGFKGERKTKKGDLNTMRESLGFTRKSGDLKKVQLGEELQDFERN